MKRISFDGAIVLITGAGDGIGKAMTLEAIARGATVIAVERDADALARLSNTAPTVVPHVADVTDAAAMGAVVDDTMTRFGRIDVAIANAGIERIAPMRLMEPQDFEDVINVNVHGVYRTLKPCLEPVIASGGHLLAVSSIAGLLPFPLGAAYSASKATVDMMMRALRMELLETGASAGAAYFGFISSDMGDRVTGHPGVRVLSKWMPTRLLGLAPILPPEAAARAVLDGVERRKGRCYAPGAVRLTYALRGLFAQSDDLLGRRVMGLPKFIRDFYG